MYSSSSRDVKNCMALICSKCKQINLPGLFPEGPPVLENGEYDEILLGHLGLDDLDPKCGLCCLLRVAWPRPNFGPPFRLRTHPLKSLERAYWDEAAFDWVYKDPVGTRWLRMAGNCLDDYISCFTWPDSDTSNCITEASTNALLDPRIDFRPIKAWIEHCFHNHSGTCRANPAWELIEGMNLIDVRNRRVVKAADHEVQYAALSYVWGTQELDGESGDGLPVLLPRTIEGAVQATRELGLDYLWVDKYCISRYNQEEKRHQINNMHRIYQQAYVTIVAAAGTGPDHGLPGISFPRAFPAHIVIDDRVFVGIPEHPLRAGAVQRSLWNTRAWTYQEEVLSRRILYFTDSQVAFHCKDGSTGIEDPIRNYAQFEKRHLIDAFEDLELSLARSEIDLHIKRINQRQITYETDRINTITGILNHLKAQGRIVGHLSGVPICATQGTLPSLSTRDWEAEFLTGLVWYMEDPAGRRTEFPSWSWAGWKGSYRTSRDMRRDNVQIWFEIQPDDSMAAILVENEALLGRDLPQRRPPLNRTIPSQEFWSMLESDGWKDSSCHFIHIEGPIIHFQFKRVDGIWKIASLEGIPIGRNIEVVVKILVRGSHGLTDFSRPCVIQLVV